MIIRRDTSASATLYENLVCLLTRLDISNPQNSAVTGANECTAQDRHPEVSVTASPRSSCDPALIPSALSAEATAADKEGKWRELTIVDARLQQSAVARTPPFTQCTQ